MNKARSLSSFREWKEEKERRFYWKRVVVEEPTITQICDDLWMSFSFSEENLNKVTNVDSDYVDNAVLLDSCPLASFTLRHRALRSSKVEVVDRGVTVGDLSGGGACLFVIRLATADSN